MEKEVKDSLDKVESIRQDAFANDPNIVVAIKRIWNVILI